MEEETEGTQPNQEAPEAVAQSAEQISSEIGGRADQAPGISIQKGSQPFAVIGNQTFATAEDLKKAYAESQKGHTQSTQKYAAELKAYGALKGYLEDLQKDPAKWKKFVDHVHGTNGQQATPAAGQAQAPQDPHFSDVSERIERTEAALEFMTFKEAHSDLAPDRVQDVVKLVLEADERGEHWTMEMAYRWLAHEENAAKLVSQGQKQAEDAITKGKNSRTLGASPTTAQSNAPKKPVPFMQRQGANAQNQRILELMEEQGIPFDQE